MPQRVVVVFSAQWRFSIFELNIYTRMRSVRNWILRNSKDEFDAATVKSCDIFELHPVHIKERSLRNCMGNYTRKQSQQEGRISETGLVGLAFVRSAPAHKKPDNVGVSPASPWGRRARLHWCHIRDSDTYTWLHKNKEPRKDLIFFY